MKLKKSQIFFISYYTVAVLATVLAIILFYDHLRLSLFSFFLAFGLRDFAFSLIAILSVGIYERNTLSRLPRFCGNALFQFRSLLSFSSLRRQSF